MPEHEYAFRALEVRYLVCNRLLDAEVNLHCEFDGDVVINPTGSTGCPWCGGLLIYRSPRRSHDACQDGDG